MIYRWATAQVDVAQLTGEWPMTPEDPGSNPVSAAIHLLWAVERQKLKDRGPRMFWKLCFCRSGHVGMALQHI